MKKFNWLIVLVMMIMIVSINIKAQSIQTLSFYANADRGQWLHIDSVKTDTIINYDSTMKHIKCFTDSNTTTKCMVINQIIINCDSIPVAFSIWSQNMARTDSVLLFRKRSPTSKETIIINYDPPLVLKTLHRIFPKKDPFNWRDLLHLKEKITLSVKYHWR